MSSTNSPPDLNAVSPAANDALAAWKRLAEEAMESRKKRASQEDVAAEILRLAKTLQRLHPAASGAIEASLSPSGPSTAVMTAISRNAAFNRALRSLAR